MLAAEPPISAAKDSADSVSTPSGSGYRSMPARPTTMAATARAESNTRLMLHAPTLPFPALRDVRRCGEHLRSLAYFRRSDLPPRVPALGPGVRVYLDIDEISPFAGLGALKRRLEFG